MQLVAYGAQDIYLTGNPQITFFKVVYKRHTNFSMETISQSMDGNATMDDSANEASCTIARNGDLIHKMYIAVLSGSSTGIKYGSAIVQSAELEIGGQKIDKHTTEWNHIWNELTTPDSKNIGLKAMQSDSGIGASTSADSVSVGMVQVPLNFYFCRNPGLALPLIALQYHEVKINFVFGISGVTGATSGTPIKFYVEYIYLDTDERRRFAQVSHEYLIEQLQFQSESASKTTFTLNFNHPVKEVIWTGAPAATGTTTSGVAPVMDADTMDPTGAAQWQLKLNGHDRTSLRHSTYYTRQQIYDYHTGYGGIQSPDSIAVYSFALKPEEHQPSGTCNFSRIDTAQLVCDIDTNGSLHIYAINYNVLRIMSGMGGLAYSN